VSVAPVDRAVGRGEVRGSKGLRYVRVPVGVPGAADRACDNRRMRTAPRAMDEHRAAVRDRLAVSGAVMAGPGSVSWKVNREIVVIAGWGRAILMQLAHPKVAAGVAEHSSFRGSLRSSLRRLSSTIRAMLSLSFGTREEAIAAAAGINRIHDRVSGRVADSAGAVAAGQHYSAHDPELLCWVHATLLDSMPLTYELLAGPLSAQERDRYCAEAAIMEPLLGIPAQLLPRSSAALNGYLRQTLDSGVIAVSPTSRTLARAILFPPGWRLMWPAFRFIQLLTIGLLPPTIRDGYGFTWTARDARALNRWTAALRTARRVTPRRLREWPAAHAGSKHVALTRN
jgi:uncharacterized protein (DUF2236 family)